MDPLSQVIALLKPQALEWRVIEAHDGWSLRFPATDVVVFGQVIEGRCPGPFSSNYAVPRASS